MSYRFGVIAAYCSNFTHIAFLSHPWGLRAMYVHFRLVGKRVEDFLYVLTELFSLGVSAEELRAKYIENRRIANGWVVIHQIFA